MYKRYNNKYHIRKRIFSFTVSILFGIRCLLIPVAVYAEGNLIVEQECEEDGESLLTDDESSENIDSNNEEMFTEKSVENSDLINEQPEADDESCNIHETVGIECDAERMYGSTYVSSKAVRVNAYINLDSLGNDGNTIINEFLFEYDGNCVYIEGDFASIIIDQSFRGMVKVSGLDKYGHVVDINTLELWVDVEPPIITTYEEVDAYGHKRIHVSIEEAEKTGCGIENVMNTINGKVVDVDNYRIDLANPNIINNSGLMRISYDITLGDNKDNTLRIMCDDSLGNTSLEEIGVSQKIKPLEVDVPEELDITILRGLGLVDVNPYIITNNSPYDVELIIKSISVNVKNDGLSNLDRRKCSIQMDIMSPDGSTDSYSVYDGDSTIDHHIVIPGSRHEKRTENRQVILNISGEISGNTKDILYGDFEMGLDFDYFVADMETTQILQ